MMGNMDLEKNGSTITNLLVCYDFVTSQLDKGKPVDVVYLDMAKAFDKVDHALLFGKLQQFGLNTKILRFLFEFLDGRKQRVILSGATSAFVPVTSGVPQGTVLGPLLFVLFINDVFQSGVGSLTLGFADDLKLVSSDPQMLQSDLDIVSNWCETNLMKLNVDKCSVIHFGKKNPRVNYQVSGSVLKPTECERDLGLLVDSKLTFENHVARVRQKSYFMINCLFRLLKTRDKKVFVKLYEQFVRPIVEYASQVYSPRRIREVSRIEKIQGFFTRKLYGFAQDRPNYIERLEELNLVALECRFVFLDLVMLFKLIMSLYNLDSSLVGVVPSRSSSLGLSHRISLPQARTQLKRLFFSYRTIKRFNALPVSVTSAQSLSVFKTALQTLASNFFSRAIKAYSPLCARSSNK